MKKEVEQDILNWVTEYVEVNHKFYNYKFPPCPYARAARLKGLLDIVAYESGSARDFINSQTEDLLSTQKYNTRVLVFPAKFRWYFHIHWFIRKLNIKIINKDFYAQYGRAVKTQSKYNELLKDKPYFIVIINKLSDVLDGHESLLKTDYYSAWPIKHYKDIVLRRNKFVEKYKKD